MRILPTSLSSRLLVVFLVTAIAAVILMSGLFSRGLGTQWQRAIVPHLVQYVAYVRDDLGSPVNEARARELSRRVPIQIQAHDTLSGDMVFTTRDSPIRVESLRFFKPGRYPGMSRRVEQRLRKDNIEDIAISDSRRHPVLRLETDGYHVYIEFARPRKQEHGVSDMLLAIVGLTLLLALCYLAIRHLLKPIGKLKTTVQLISDGDLSARTNAVGRDDLAQLAKSVDRMSERIQKMLDAKRELLLAISHELRSPLTRARVAAEMLEPSRHQGKLIGDIEAMDALIAQLVESERLQTHVVLDWQNVDVREVISEIVASLDADVDWISPTGNFNLQADRTRVHVLIRNLIDNALLHGKNDVQSASTVSIDTQASDNDISVVISDNGPGISEEHLGLVTEAFYRPDASRTRKTGGIGLGLYLCQRIVEAHGGTLTIESPKTRDVGTVVTVTLPRNESVDSHP